MATQKLLDSLGRFSTGHTVDLLWPIFAPQSPVKPATPADVVVHANDWNNLRRLLYAALLYSNVPLLQSVHRRYGNLLAAERIPVIVDLNAVAPEARDAALKEAIEKERRNALLTALGSCRYV